MSDAFEKIAFGGKCIKIVEEELGASIGFASEKEQDDFFNGLYAEYVTAGKPKQIKNWLREKLSPMFKSVEDAPNWIEDLPKWPWLNGKPMLFLGQFQVPDTEIAKEHAVPNVMLYLFGSRVATTGGWRMEYRVVEQRADLKGVVALAESEQPPHRPDNTKLVKRKP